MEIKEKNCYLMTAREMMLNSVDLADQCYDF